MADEVVSQVVSQAPITQVAPATPPAAPAVNPSVDAAPPIASVVETPAVAAVVHPVVAPVVDPVVEAPAPSGTTLGDLAKPEVKEPVVEEIAKAAEGAEPKKEEAKQSDEPAPLPTYEAFKVPEGVSFDAVKLGEFQKELAEYQVLTKADQAETQKFGQKLMDRHIAEIQDVDKKIGEHNTKAWEKQTSDWKEAFKKDPEFGGNRQETTLAAAKVALNAGISLSQDKAISEKHYTEYNELMNTGVGEHPALIRTFANLGNIILALKAEKAALISKYETDGDVKPLAGTKPTPEKRGKAASMYGNMG